MVKRFTLIELLVVIAIIGVLATLLMPSLSKARAKAKEAVCRSNLKQNAIAQHLYIDSNEERFSPALLTNVSWDDLLSDLMGRELSQSEKDEAYLPDTVKVDNTVLQCPADERQMANDKVKRSFAMNSGGTEWGGNFTGLTRLHRSVLLTEVTDHSNTIMYGERFNPGNSIGGNNSTELGDYHSDHWKDSVHTRVDFYNVVFVDGHIEFLHGGVIDPGKMDR